MGPQDGIRLEIERRLIELRAQVKALSDLLGGEGAAHPAGPLVGNIGGGGPVPVPGSFGVPVPPTPVVSLPAPPVSHAHAHTPAAGDGEPTGRGRGRKRRKAGWMDDMITRALEGSERGLTVGEIGERIQQLSGQKVKTGQINTHLTKASATGRYVKDVSEGKRKTRWNIGNASAPAEPEPEETKKPRGRKGS
jgi:hypothetical protein